MKKLTAFLLTLVLFSVNAFAAQYTVVSGDTLFKIASKYGMTLDEILSANPSITNPDNIYVGTILYIPERSGPSGRESLSYLYAGTTASYLKILNGTNNSINTVCPDYFDIDASGNLLITPSNKIDVDFINEAHRRGILITPFISNHWDRAKGNAALDNREALSTQAAEMIEKYNLDGINIDIENVNEQFRQKYTDFTRLLREKLPPNKAVTVAVAANPNGWNTGWHGSYDYKALADYSDYLMIMIYDESYQGSPAGPVSSSGFFDNSIKYALKQGVPKEKIVAGIPFFGRYWKEGEASGGIGITANDIEYLISNYPSEYSYDQKSQSANLTVTISPSDPKPMLWGGRSLSEGKYNIWYDDLNSVRHKLVTISEYDLKGAGSWALGQENTAIWSFYTEVLNGGKAVATPTPTPTPTITPKPTPSETPSPSEPPKPTPERAYIEIIIELLAEKGNSRPVQPQTILTRGEVAVVLAEICNVSPEPDGQSFYDTEGYWGKGQINALRRRGVVKGEGDNRFYPDKAVTREEICAMLERILVLENTIDFHDMTFRDVDAEMWSYNSIAKLYYFNLIKGYGNDEFGPYNGVEAGAVGIILDRIKENEYSLNPDKFLQQRETRKTPIPSELKDPIINPR